MIFMLFALAIAALFFVGSILLLNLGQQLGLRYRKRSGTEGTGGLATVEGAIFGLMGLLLAFTISGALQRFDDRTPGRSVRPRAVDEHDLRFVAHVLISLAHIFTCAGTRSLESTDSI